MRRNRRKGGNKDKVFGCDLMEHLNASSQEIPLVLRCCSEFVETHGIVDGIYRLSGVSSNIQKLRGEFEGDSSPDLNRDLYLQDIHCVSSLCKAYFRELPNPLLTYQLYDKFAEAVAIQLEEERLVKIRDVLKELPSPHYRTLEFLMRHLVRMASFSSETNMHARNLAIVWAPNLLRSKDIEASGFNGTAAFMEVRVQSIVVEFILTHVPQLFSGEGGSEERRNSLPFPTAACIQDEGPIKEVHPQHVPNFGNISPGDGPLPIRPYHAIIEGTDKRKGSLKGRKWMSIFNIGGRFPDPRRRHKHSTKEKERPTLRPARSMDSLSTQPYPNEGSRRPGHRPPSVSKSPLAVPIPTVPSDAPVSPGAMGGSQYAVTYRRGTGLVSGGGGTQGTYTALDPEGLGVAGGDTVQSRSPGISTKQGRRAAMHITGPTLVTVPLHITSNLAGVLQRGGADRIIHRGRDHDGGDRADGEKVERKEKKMGEGRKEEEEETNHTVKVTGGEGVEEKVAGGGGGSEGKKEEEKVEKVEESRSRSVSRSQRTKSLNSNTEEDHDEDEAVKERNFDEGEYIDMSVMKQPYLEPDVSQCGDVPVFDSSQVHNSTALDGDDLGLSGYVQDNFEFLDQMDCSVMDHMDCSVSYQVNEFSVEPPGHSDDEYEIMVHTPLPPSPLPPSPPPPPLSPSEHHTHHSPGPDTKPHRPLSLDINSRHTKSLSLPYMTSPVRGPEDESSSEEEEEEAAGDDEDEDSDVISYSSDDDDENMFVKSLPADFLLNNYTDFPDGVPGYGYENSEPLNHHSSSNEEATEAEEHEQVEVENIGDTNKLEEEEITKMEEEDHQDVLMRKSQEDDHMEDHSHSDKAQTPASEASTHETSTESPLQIQDESHTMAEEEEEEEEEEVVDFSPCHAASRVKDRETADVVVEEELGDFSAEATKCPIAGVRSDTVEKDRDEGEDVCQEVVLEIKESDEDMWEDVTEEESEDEKIQEVQGSATRRTSSGIWEELEDVICEVIEFAENMAGEKKGARGSVAREDEDVEIIKEEEQVEEDSGEKEVEERGTKEADVRMEVEEESVETTEDKVLQTFEEGETSSKKREASQRKHGTNEEARHHDKQEVVTEDKQKNNEERGDEQRRKSVDGRPGEEVKGLKDGGGRCQEGEKIQGVGRKLVVSKQPRFYQAKAVPVVPPKPQHCKITALTIRHQQQQREKKETPRVQTEQEKVCSGDDGEEGGGARNEKPTPRERERERERERRRDGDEGALRDANRNSPLSMCFDEAVAIATLRREKEKECEKEKERQRDWSHEVQ